MARGRLYIKGYEGSFYPRATKSGKVGRGWIQVADNQVLRCCTDAEFLEELRLPFFKGAKV